MKKNGFAVAGILYPLLVLFLCFMLLLLGNLMSERFRLDKVKNNILNSINGELPNEQFQNTSLYSLDNIYYTDAYKEETYRLLEQLGVTRIYQSINDLTSQEMIQSLEEMNKKGFDVYDLSGDSSWYNRPDLIKARIDSIKTYNNNYSEYPIRGLVLDVPFYQEAAWNTDPLTTINTMIATYEEMIPYAHENGLEVILCLPNWLDSNYETQLDTFIQISDRTSIMNYDRRFLIEGISKELEIAQKYNKPIEFISEFSYISGEEKYLSYYEDGLLKAYEDWKVIQGNAENVDVNFAYHDLEPLLEIQKNYKKYSMTVIDRNRNILSNDNITIKIMNGDKTSYYTEDARANGTISIAIPSNYAYEIYSNDYLIGSVSTPIQNENEYEMTVQLAGTKGTYTIALYIKIWDEASSQYTSLKSTAVTIRSVDTAVTYDRVTNSSDGYIVASLHYNETYTVDIKNGKSYELSFGSEGSNNPTFLYQSTDGSNIVSTLYIKEVH